MLSLDGRHKTRSSETFPKAHLIRSWATAALCPLVCPRRLHSALKIDAVGLTLLCRDPLSIVRDHCVIRGLYLCTIAIQSARSITQEVPPHPL